MRIDVGVYTPFTVNLSKYNFSNCTKVVFTLKNSPEVGSPVVAEREYTEPKLYNDVITPEESVLLRNGAVYDFNEISRDGKRYKICDNKKVILRKGCGHCQTT